MQRFLSGPLNPEDLTKVLLFLREQSFGRKTVHDVGNMIGHADRRDRGVSVDRVNELAKVMRYQAPKIERLPKESPVDLINAPPEIVDVMDYTFRHLSDENIKKETGLTRAQLSTHLTRAKKKLVPNGRGGLEWGSSRIKIIEANTIGYLTSRIITEPAYSGNEYYEEFTMLCLKHGFVDSNQLDALKAKRPIIILHAVAAMHGVAFDMYDGSNVTAQAGWGGETGAPIICVNAYVPINWRGGSDKIRWGFTVMDTDLRADEWFDGYDPTKKHAGWKVAIELTAEGKVTAIE